MTGYTIGIKSFDEIMYTGSRNFSGGCLPAVFEIMNFKSLFFEFVKNKCMFLSLQKIHRQIHVSSKKNIVCNRMDLNMSNMIFHKHTADFTSYL